MTHATGDSRLRSRGWFGAEDVNSFVHRAWLHAEGADDEDFDGRPVVGILKTASDATPFNAHMRRLAEDVRGASCERGEPRSRSRSCPWERLDEADRHALRNLAAMGERGAAAGLPGRQRLIHLVALARRLGMDFANADFDRLSRETPVVGNVVPGGEYQMEGFFNAGGIPVVMRALVPLLEADATTVTG